MLARSRYVLYKSSKKWIERQNKRAQILFSLYPDIKTAHRLIQQLPGVYNNKLIAMTKLAH
ncbi:transposase [Flavobacterium sp. EDS]|uniref:transposase n=1 Tax=Flavobacterium sp. EDS TaxID=2897328 RepID=UPI0021036B33|nr:transposase [Flavobacterium sp. EDS]